MEIVVLKCDRCGLIKDFWLTSAREKGFKCKCYSGLLKKYHDSSYLDYFVSLIRHDSLTVDGLVALAKKEHLIIDRDELEKKLQGYDLKNNLSFREFYHMVEIVLRSGDKYWFRKYLAQLKDKESILKAISQYSPRVDIYRLGDYLDKTNIPLDEETIITMENIIAKCFYNLENIEVKVWD